MIARLADVREKQGLSYEELGGRTGLHPTSLSLIERQKRQPTFVNLLRLALALNVRLSNIVREAEAAVNNSKSVPSANRGRGRK